MVEIGTERQKWYKLARSVRENGPNWHRAAKMVQISTERTWKWSKLTRTGTNATNWHGVDFPVWFC